MRSPEEAKVEFWYQQWQASTKDHAETRRELEELRRVSGAAHDAAIAVAYHHGFNRRRTACDPQLKPTDDTQRPAYTRAVALIAALNEEAGPGRVLHGALQAAILAEANAIDAYRRLPESK